MNKQLLVVLTALSLLALFAGGAWVYQDQEAERLSFLASEQAQTFVPDHAVTVGQEDARVYLVEFFDPACETCAGFYHPIKKLMADHPGRIKLVYRYAPFHAGSEEVVKMLHASQAQGKYVEVLEMMLGSQRYWASHHNPQPELLWQFLPQVGVDAEALREEMAKPTYDAVLAQDLADVEALGVRKTPSFFVNGKPLAVFGYAELVALVESELALQYPEP